MYNDTVSKLSKKYLGKDAVYNFINNLIEESKYFSEMMKKHFNEELAMTKEDDEDFKISTKCLIWENNYIDNDVRVKNHCHITGKYRIAKFLSCFIT